MHRAVQWIVMQLQATVLSREFAKKAKSAAEEPLIADRFQRRFHIEQMQLKGITNVNSATYWL